MAIQSEDGQSESGRRRNGCLIGAIPLMVLVSLLIVPFAIPVTFRLADRWFHVEVGTPKRVLTPLSDGLGHISIPRFGARNIRSGGPNGDYHLWWAKAMGVTYAVETYRGPDAFF